MQHPIGRASEIQNTALAFLITDPNQEVSGPLHFLRAGRRFRLGTGTLSSRIANLALPRTRPPETEFFFSFFFSFSF